MIKKALMILAVSSVVTVPSLAITAHGATLPLHKKSVSFAANTTQYDWKGKETSSTSTEIKHGTTKIKTLHLVIKFG
ncbi:hypothetical protein P4V64_30805 [Bacillus thuringiensis]|nr:hypothetical protein [Bacillus thuringiensis]